MARKYAQSLSARPRNICSERKRVDWWHVGCFLVSTFITLFGWFMIAAGVIMLVNLIAR